MTAPEKEAAPSEATAKVVTSETIVARADLDRIPSALRELQGWLVWRNERGDAPKLRKVPSYVGGGRRGVNGTAEDRAKLATFDAARKALDRGGVDGIGLALLPEFDLVALDFDHAIADGAPLPEVEDLVLGTYAEVSPSGRGVRAFMRGAGLPNAKSTGPGFGFETFATAGWVTVTGRRLDVLDLLGQGDRIAPVSDAVRALYRARFGERRGEADDDPLMAHQPRLGLSVERLREMLAALDPDLPHDEWLHAGMALHHERGGSDDGFALWLEWSSRGEKFPGERKLRHRWESFGRREGGQAVTARTLVKMAQAEGWRGDVVLPEPERELRGPLLVQLDESRPLRPLPMLIRGVLPADGLGMLWGEPGSFKSFLAIDWALCVATGTPWLGHPAKSAEVWYIAGEGHEGLARRVAAWRRVRGVDGPLRFMHSPQSILLDDESGKGSPELRKLIATIEGGEAPALITVDTLARAMMGDESATKDASRFVQALDRLIGAVRRAGKPCTILLVHHARKDGGEYRGSSVLRGAVDFEYELARGEGMTAVLASRKTKDAAAPPSLRLVAGEVDLGDVVDEFGETVPIKSLVLDLDRPDGQPLPAIGQKAMRLLPAITRALEQFPGGASQRTLRDALVALPVKFDKTILGGVLDFLAQHGHIAIETEGRAQRIRLVAGQAIAQGVA